MTHARRHLMFGDHFAPAKQLLAILQSVAGPTRAITDVRDARSHGRWEHVGQYRGRPLRMVLLHRYTSGSVGRLEGVELGVSLGDRPIEVSLVLAPPGASGFALPNGQPSILPHAQVSGFPLEVVRAALDQGTVAAMRAEAAASGVDALTTMGDWLCTFVRVETPDGFSPRPTPMPDAAAIVRVLDLLCSAADRLTGAFDRAHAEAHRAGGPAAAAQWLAAQRGAAHLRREARQRTVAIIVSITVLVIVVVVLMIVGLALFVRC